jgi:hypothetical protein
MVPDINGEPGRTRTSDQWIMSKKRHRYAMSLCYQTRHSLYPLSSLFSPILLCLCIFQGFTLVLRLSQYAIFQLFQSG